LHLQEILQGHIQTTCDERYLCTYPRSQGDNKEIMGDTRRWHPRVSLFILNTGGEEPLVPSGTLYAHSLKFIV
jgi:hypothetical protein